MDLKFEAINPHNGENNGSFDFETKEQIADKISRSHAAFLKHRETSVEDRVAKVLKLAEVMKARKQEIAETCSKEMGKCITESSGEVDGCVGAIPLYAESVKYIQNEEANIGAEKTYIKYEPMGSLFIIIPWNYPIFLPIMQCI